MTNYSELILEAIAALKEKKGSSRQAIWKYVRDREPDCDEVIFKRQLKRLLGSKLKF